MRYGFIIDNRKCIGCHACTVACKTENHVPLTVNRTWVKYVEKGMFPNTRRVFQVTRCNHCENPPCVTICPVTAMYQRKDGIVDFSSERCIGCKACMQACPYDSIYIDPDEGTAAKCHFCAHRTEVGLEPSCVVVCPEHAIIAGDLDACDGEIAQLLAREPVRVRKPEQGTRPKLYYIDGDESAIVPTAARHEPMYMWAQRNPMVHGGGAIYPPDSPLLQKNALAAYDVAHARPWGWQVPAYCWTRAIGRGPDARFGFIDDCVAVYCADNGAAGLGSGAQDAVSARGVHAAEAVVAGGRRIHPDRVQRVEREFLDCVGAGLVRDYCNSFVADSALGIYGGHVHRIFIWAMRRARFVADAAFAGAFGRAGVNVRSGGAGLASGCGGRIGCGARGGEGRVIGEPDISSADRRRGIFDAALDRQCRLCGTVDYAWSVQELVLDWKRWAGRNLTLAAFMGARAGGRADCGGVGFAGIAGV